MHLKTCNAREISDLHEPEAAKLDCNATSGGNSVVVLLELGQLSFSCLLKEQLALKLTGAYGERCC